jgi:Fe-Mn family superoxide dismutase
MTNDTSRRVRVELPELPYPIDALQPFISARTLQIHYGRHHRAYVEKTNTLMGDARGTLEELIVRSSGDPSKRALFNTQPRPGTTRSTGVRYGAPQGAAVPREFAGLLQELKTKAIGQFAAAGSGWCARVRISRLSRPLMRTRLSCME